MVHYSLRVPTISVIYGDEMNILEYDDLEVEDFTTLGGMAMFFIDASRKRVIHLPIVTYNSRWLIWITAG